MPDLGCLVVVGHWRTLSSIRERVRALADVENLDVHLFVQASDRPLFHKRANASDVDATLSYLKPKTLTWHTYSAPSTPTASLFEHACTISHPGKPEVERIAIPPAPFWAADKEQAAKKATFLFPQFFVQRLAYDRVRAYETAHGLSYARWVRTRPDLWVDPGIALPMPQNAECIVPVFVSGGFVHGIGDHFAVCGPAAARAYFTSEESFRDGRSLPANRDFCFFRKDLAAQPKHHESTHATLHCHLANAGVKVTAPANWVVTATRTVHPFYVVRA